MYHPRTDSFFQSGNNVPSKNDTAIHFYNAEFSQLWINFQIKRKRQDLSYGFFFFFFATDVHIIGKMKENP